VPETEKVIVFSQWSHSLNLIGSILKQKGIKYENYHSLGCKSLQDRNHIIDEFKAPATKVLLATTASAGIGLNLVCANHIILLDPWWNQASEDQAIDRAYRIGQTKDVHVHRLYMTASLEEWMISLKSEKHNVSTTFHSANSEIHQIDQTFLKNLLKKFLGTST
jgi:SNF2 family DNA or RNA helicase